MDSFTFNKIAGVFLGTCLVGMGLGIVANGIYSSEAPEKPGFVLPNPKPEAAGAPEAKPAEASLPVLLAKADPKRGEADTKICQSCHNFAEGAGTKIGPDLYGVVDRPKGSVAGFDYSPGMKAKGGKWTLDDLNTFLTKPSAYVTGTKMGYQGEESPEKRADIIVYLNTLSKTPAPLPKPAEGDKKPVTAAAPAGAPAAPAAGGGDAELVKMIGAADPKKGQANAQICSACHSVKDGGGVLVGPPLWGVVDRPKASVAGFDYSAGLKAKGGKWTYADLNVWLTNPAAYVPGTKMGYPGEASEKKRAEIIAFLRTLAKTPAPLGDVAAAPAPAVGKAPPPAAAGALAPPAAAAAHPAPAAAPPPPAAAAPAPAKTEQKTEAAPAEAAPMDTASQGPEPYDAVDPETGSGPPAAASATMAPTPMASTPAKTEIGDDAGAAATLAVPEPYSAPAPEDAAKN